MDPTYQPPSSTHLPSTFFCHPDSIIPGAGNPNPNPMPIAASDLFAFSRAIHTSRVVQGCPSHYANMFEESDVFIRVVTSRPLQVRTFIPQYGVHDPFFYEYPPQVPSVTYFQLRAILLDKRPLTCNTCGKTFASFFYYRDRYSSATTGTRSSRTRRIVTDPEKGEADESKGLSQLGGDGDARRGRRVMVRRLVKRARRYISQGVKWVESRLKRKSKQIPVITGVQAGPGPDPVEQ
jgi:hypothetical protein